MAAVSGAVAMSATTSMVVTGDSHITTPSLYEQIVAICGQDPALLGATGYVDDVFTTRLVGDVQ